MFRILIHGGRMVAPSPGSVLQSTQTPWPEQRGPVVSRYRSPPVPTAPRLPAVPRREASANPAARWGGNTRPPPASGDSDRWSGDGRSRGGGLHDPWPRQRQARGMARGNSRSVARRARKRLEGQARWKGHLSPLRHRRIRDGVAHRRHRPPRVVELPHVWRQYPECRPPALEGWPATRRVPTPAVLLSGPASLAYRTCRYATACHPAGRGRSSLKRCCASRCWSCAIGWLAPCNCAREKRPRAAREGLLYGSWRHPRSVDRDSLPRLPPRA